MEDLNGLYTILLTQQQNIRYYQAKRNSAKNTIAYMIRQILRNTKNEPSKVYYLMVVSSK